MAKITFKGIAMGRYKVFVDGVLVGEVAKKVARYNLRRVLVTTEWYGNLDGGERVPAHGGYDTRRDAVAALVEKASA